MLLPLSDVPRWYAQRKPQGTIAVRHGQDTLTWDELERGANRRARAFMAKGVKPGDFVAIGLPNGNAFFETSFAVWKCGATPTSLSWRLPRGEAAAVLDILEARAGGRRRGRLERAEPPAGGFRAGRIFGRAARSAGGALLESHDQRRLDRPAESDPRSSAGRDRHRRRAAAQHSLRRLAAQSRSALPQCAVHRVALRAVYRRPAHRPRQVRRRGDAAADRARARAMGQFRADHDAPDLGAAGERAQRLRHVEPSDRLPHGGSDAALAEGELDRLARP